MQCRVHSESSKPPNWMYCCIVEYFLNVILRATQIVRVTLVNPGDKSLPTI